MLNGRQQDAPTPRKGDSIAEEDQNRLRFSKAALVREAAIPLRDLELQIAWDLIGATEKVFEIEQRMAPLADSLVEHLLATIPRLDKPTRRQALDLKRGIFSKGDSIDPGPFARIAEHLGCGLVYSAWSDLAVERQGVIQAGRRDFEDLQTRATNEFIARCLSNEQFKLGLSCTSPGIAGRLPDLHKQGKKARHIRAKVTRFAVRAATSTAPLNRLASVSLVVGGTESTASVGVETRLSQESFWRYFESIAPASLRYWTNDTLRWQGDVCSFLGTHHIGTSKPRAAVNRHVRLPRPVSSVLKSLTGRGPHDGQNLQKAFREAGLNQEDLDSILRELVNAAVLTPHVTDGLSIDNRALAGQLETLGFEQIAAHVAAIDGAESELHRHELSKLFAATAEAAPANHVYETRWQPSPLSPAFVEGVQQDALRPFLEKLPEFVEPHPIYCRLLRDFIWRFGQGGRHESALAWLQNIELGSSVEFSKDTPRTETLQAPLGLSVYFEIRSRGPRQPPIVHCETMHCQVGWQVGRFTFGTSDTVRHLRATITEDLRKVAGAARAVTLSADPDLINIQANPALFDPVIVFPGQTPTDRPSISAAGLAVQHDPASNRLKLYAGEEEIRPFYNGGMIPFPRFGTPFMMALLSEPFRLRPFAPPLQLPLEPIFSRTEPSYLAGVMVGAGAWYIPVGDLKLDLANLGFDRMLAVRRLWRRIGINDQGWICGCNSAGKSPFSLDVPVISKPQWFDARVDSNFEIMSELLRGGYEWIILFDAMNPSEIPNRERGRATSILTEAYYPQISVPLPI